MRKYISVVNAYTSCIYGDYKFIIGIEVPEIFAKKYPSYVTFFESPDPIIEKEEDEDIEKPTKHKKQRSELNE
jgi:hypothetical protein